MTAMIYDIVTGCCKTLTGPRAWEWVEGDWSCDCNRNPWGIDTGKPDGVCEGAERFLVIQAEGDQYTLNELNRDYAPELVAQVLSS